MNKVKAISFEQVQCGKKIADTKKRFKWTFQVNQNNYVLEVVNSALSGKRAVFLNSKQLYSQKNVLNLKFQFHHQIDGHALTVTKKGDKINDMHLTIDGKNFQLMLNKEKGLGENVFDQNYFKTKSGTNNFQNDPFSDFMAIAQSSKNKKTNDFSTKNPQSFNQFGAFDFDAFQQVKKQSQQKKLNSSQKSSMNNEFRKHEQIQTQTFGNNLDMNMFQTNGISMFQKNFKNAEQDININYNDFATNSFANSNNFMNLNNNKDSSSQFSNIQKEKKFEKNSIGDKLNLNDVKFDFNGKKAINNMRIQSKNIEQKINQIHLAFSKKIVDKFQSFKN